MSDEVTTAEIASCLEEDNTADNTGAREPQDGDNSAGVDKDEGARQGRHQADRPKFDNLEAALKGYQNLEKKLGEQSGELGRLRKAAQEAEQLREHIMQAQLAEARDRGFNSVEDYQYSRELAKTQQWSMQNMLMKLNTPMR